MIYASNLNRQYGAGTHRVSAVHDVTLRIESGERVAIVGRSGSGKTTLLNLLAGLDHADSGTLTVDGLNIGELNRNEMAGYRLQAIGVVFQSFQLVPQRTAAENVELPLIIAGCSASERRPRVEQALEQVGLADRASHRPWEMSGGEQQRVAIARAMINTPRVLLADEPTGNLDSRTAVEIRDLMLQLCDSMSATFVLVTHDLTFAHECTGRILTMADGCLREGDNT